MITLHRISSKNFKSLRGKTDFSFDEVKAGMYQVFGENGSGKSTLFIDLPYWIMFGKTPRGLKARDIHSWKSSGNTSGTLVFSIDDKSHTITREWNPNKLILDGENVDQKTINDLVKLNEESIQHAIFIAQFSEMFFDLKPTARLDLVSGILDLDYWLECSNKASTKRIEINRKLSDIQVQIGNIQGRTESLIEQAEQYEAKLDTFDREKDAKVARIKKQISGADIELEQLEERIANLDKEIAKDQKELAKAQKAVNKMKAQVSEENSKVSELEQQKVKLDTNYENVSSQLEKLESLGAVCPTCEQKINHKNISSTIEELQARMEEIFDETEKVETQLAKLDETTARLEDEVSSLIIEENNLSSRIAVSTRAKGLAEGSIQNTMRQINAMEKQLREAENEKNPYDVMLNDAIAKLEGLATKEEELKAEEGEYNRQLAAHDYWIKGYKELRLFVVEDVLNNLEIQVNNYINDLGLEGWSIKFDVEKENRTGGVSKGFHIMIESPESDGFVPWESWSGGEAQRLKLAGTLGLADLIGNFSGIHSNLLVLDEPTKHMNDEGINNLLNLLYNKAKEESKVVLFIDHHAYDYGGFAGEFEVVKTDQGTQVG